MPLPPNVPETMVHTDELQEVVALCDPDGIILSWNRAGEEVTGFQRADLIGYHVDSVVTAGTRSVVDELFALRGRGSVLPGIPCRLQTTFGWEVPAEVTSVARRLTDGTTGYLLMFRDATLTHQLQEHLDRMDALYRGLVDGSPDVIYVLDASGKLLFINDTVESLLGFHKRDLIGRELIDVVHPEDRSRAYWPLRERRRADRATRNLRLRLLTRDGETRRYDLGFIYVSLDSIGLGRSGQGPGHLAAAPAEQGPRDEHLGTQGVARDVTELVLLQEFSRQAELILPVCSVCHKIRAGSGENARWLPLAEYVEQQTGVLYSHTYCPDHLPSS